jgi:biotin operon repressor
MKQNKHLSEGHGKIGKKTGQVIMIPKQLRMDWMDVMGTDRGLQPASYKVAAVIGTHFDNKSGMTYVSQEKIAKVTGLGEATVKRAVMDLERRGYILIQRREIGKRVDGRKVYGGKGVANVYLPAVDAVQISATDRGQRLVDRVRRNWVESQNAKQVTGDLLNVSKEVMGDHLNDRDSRSNTSIKQVTGDLPTLTSPTEKNSSRAGGPSSPDGLGPFGAILAARIGADRFKHWFGTARLGDVTADTMTLEMPNKFIRDRAAQDFEPDLLICCQIHHPTIRRVSLIVREAA